MSIQVLYFASLKENLGCASESIEWQASLCTVASLREYLIAQGRTALASAKNLRCAVNQDMAGLNATVRDGDEIAFFPPVTGG